MTPTLPLVLASASPRRKELLERAGLRFTVRAADVDESPRDGEDPAAMAVRLAREKAEAVAATLDEPSVVLAADTVVILDGESLGKPRDEDEARATLRKLSGRQHEVVTGFAILHAAVLVIAAPITTAVRFRQLGDDTIAAYVATGEPMDKAGAYGIQGIGAALVRAISGSYTNVVGLPLAEVIEALPAGCGGGRL